MTEQEIVDLVQRTLWKVAPDLEGEPIDPDKTFHEQFEIDSMDFLNFVIGLSEATGREIPEDDHPRLASLAGCIRYFQAR